MEQTGTPPPEPACDELRADAKGKNEPWSEAAKQIVAQTEDLTVLYYVGVGKRSEANQNGLSRWTDPAVTPGVVGVGGAKLAPRLQALLDVNRETEGSPVRPARVETRRDEWHEQPPLEFYVDFETVNSLDDDFSQLPIRGGQELIFMIGCGHVTDGEWVYRCFTADRLAEPDEARIIDAWFEHMQAVRAHLAPGVDASVIHWSHAEETWLETAWYAAVKRHPEKNWPHPNWFNFLTKVIREEPVTVRGAHGFGLKAVTKAMHDLGLVDTEWGDGPADGLGAMIGAWWCEHEAERRDKSLIDLELMQQIAGYNEVDCRAMAEIVTHLRTAH